MSVASLASESVTVAFLSQHKSPQGGLSKDVWTTRAGSLRCHSNEAGYHVIMKYGNEANTEYRIFFFATNPSLTRHTTSIVRADGRRFIVRDIDNPRGHHWEIIGSWLGSAV